MGIMRKRIAQAPSAVFPDHVADVVRVTENDPHDILGNARNCIIVGQARPLVLPFEKVERLENALRVEPGHHRHGKFHRLGSFMSVT